MARTPLFTLMQKLILRAMQDQGIDPARRRFIKLSAGALAATALSTVPGVARAMASQRIAIIGAGAAGLTAAYRLVQAGVKPYIFEASNRLGGRMYTKDNFNQDGQFCELGGELVDSNHESLINLCKELHINLQNLVDEDSGSELYFFNEEWYSEEDMIGQSGAFHKIARKLAADQDGLETDDGYTTKARKLDAMPLSAYIDKLKPLAPAWVIEMLTVAYTCEYGAPISQQSALNMILLIGANAEDTYNMFGASDESWRIMGGSSRLIEGLSKVLDGKINLSTGSELTALSTSGKQIECSFGSKRERFDRVILALPFTLLRKVEGLSNLGLSAGKLKAIRELGYGTNAKIMFSTASRPWRDAAIYKQPSNGAFYTDLPMQTMWECSRGQSGKRGVLVNFMGGAAGTQKPDERIEIARNGMEKYLIADIGRALKDEPVAPMFWAKQRWVQGSYAAPKPGQVTGVVPYCPLPELGGRLLFAGEHTSVQFQGFMNGAVESGDRVAKEALA